MTEFLRSLAGLDDPGTKEFTPANGKEPGFFLVRKDGQVFAYENRCPHAGQKLNRDRNSFLTLGESHLRCSAHAATFEIETGACIGGPCAGKALTPVPLHRKDDELFLG